MGLKSASFRQLPTAATSCRHKPFCEPDRIPAGIYLKQPQGGTAGRGCGGRGREAAWCLFLLMKPHNQIISILIVKPAGRFLSPDGT